MLHRGSFKDHPARVVVVDVAVETVEKYPCYRNDGYNALMVVLMKKVGESGGDGWL